MALTKCKLGDHIELRGKPNSSLTYGIDDVRGVNNLKQLMPTKADLNGRDLSKFQIVYPGEFVFNHRTSRNGSKFSIAYNSGEKPVICTEDYVVFRIKESSEVLLSAEWLYMYFNRSEFDRFVITNSWGSSTEFYNWEDICSIDLELPLFSVQEKYVGVYRAMLANQQSYERGLKDLKLVCDACIDKLNDCYRSVGDFVEKNQKKNQDRKFTKTEVKGFNNDGQFIKPMRLFSGDVAKCTILQKNDFVYNLRVNSTIERLSIAINESCDLIVSPDYESFCVVKDDELYPYYLYMLLQRDSFAKKVLYVSFGSSTTYFRFNNLCEIKIPVPEYSKQVDIAMMYRTYKERWIINEKLKAQIKDICPILIRGSLEE